MTNDPGRAVSFKSDGETFTLYAGNAALRLIERETGRPVLDAIGSLSNQTEITLLTTIVWALLQKHHADLTIDDVDDIIDGAGGWEGLLDPLGLAIERAFKTNDAHEKNDSGKARRGTGTKSSPAALSAA
jgi:hypothetical protein